MSETAAALAGRGVVDASTASGRIQSLDAFRGLTVAAMILVNNPGSWSYTYPPLSHAKWHGWTLADLIFPAFLFIVGVAMALSFAGRLQRGATRPQLALHSLRRAFIIFAIGLGINALMMTSWATLRIPGVLQRIAVCYLFASAIYLSMRRPSARSLAVISIVILALYWALLAWVPVPGHGAGRLDAVGSLPAYIDQIVLGAGHVWRLSVTYDPEGLLSTLPAIASVLFGLSFGLQLRTASSSGSSLRSSWIAGAALVVAGLALNPLLPINKTLWTSSFVLLSSGLSALGFLLCYWLMDVHGRRALTAPLRVFGSNAILAYSISMVYEIYVGAPRIVVANETISLREWSFRSLHGFIPDPYLASLTYGVLVLAALYALLLPLHRRGWFLKV